MKITKVILLITSLDKSANRDRAEHLASAIRNEGHSISIFDTQKFFAHMVQMRYIRTSPKHFLKYFEQLILYKAGLRPSYPMIEEMHVRERFLSQHIKKLSPQLIICQNPQDILCLLHTKTKTIYDAPSLFSQLMRYGGYNSSVVRTFSSIERTVLGQSNAVTFHWPIFQIQAKLQKIDIPNLFTANYGCTARTMHASYSNNPKIVYVGNASSQWVNPPLLASIALSTSYSLDLYGYEQPKEQSLMPYFRGYLHDLDTVGKYQFGLVTADDSIPNFSAKHLLYISYGLPVLCPEWRKDPLLESATIYYNKQNFDALIRFYSKESNWSKKHNAAILLAKKLSWEKTLRPFIKVVNNMVAS